MHVQSESEILMQTFCLPQRGKHCKGMSLREAGKAGGGLPEHTLDVDTVTVQKPVEAVGVLSCFSGVRLFATPWTACGQPGSSVHGIFWARILEWVAISPSRASSQPRDQTPVFCISCLTGKFFTTESPGKPNIISHGSLLYSVQQAVEE